MTRIQSMFSRGLDGWTIEGDVAVFEQRPTGGSPGGFLFWQDSAAGADSYWNAPAKFLGDLSEFGGGRLTFDWYASADNYQNGDVLITGTNGVTLVGDVTDPGAGWTDAAIRLGVTGNWHVDTIDGPLATVRQIRAVLANVTQLQIRAEHVNGGETGGLDSVALISKPVRPLAAEVFGDDRHAGAADVTSAHHAPDAMHLTLV